MADEYVEPTNEQLANFLVVYAPQIFPGSENLQLSPPILEMLLNNHPEKREGALRHHRKFVEETNKFVKKMAAGELQCEHIRPNGRRCPNANEPGRMYCGLHGEDDE